MGDQIISLDKIDTHEVNKNQNPTSRQIPLERKNVEDQRSQNDKLMEYQRSPNGEFNVVLLLFNWRNSRVIRKYGRPRDTTLSL